MKKPLEILLIEDDIDDVDLLKEALNDNKVDYVIEVIMEGDKVYKHLHTAASTPEMIIMDLNLPKTDGKEILLEIKSSPALTNIPIVVLTTSSSYEDIEYCRKMGANKFITKPSSIEGWNEAIHSIMDVASAIAT